MEHIVYAAIIALVILILSIVWLAERKDKRRISAEKSEIVIEERRMFDFLHGLGEKLQEDSSPARMHSYIVEGIAGVVKAEAGILYLLDGGTRQLVPVYQSRELAPVIPIPKEIRQIEDDAEAASRYRSYIRLSALELNETLIGRAMDEIVSINVPDLLESTDFQGESKRFHTDVSLLAAPLIYGKKRVGVLAVTKRSKEIFSENDREVFESVAEQCSFALGSAIIHAEAAEKRRMESELTQASEIQRVLLPDSAPELSDYAIAARYDAARLVSGDYYDYIRVDEDRFGIAIGDVCGKGIAASLIMAMCRSNLRGRAPENLSPASVLHAVNRSIFPDIKGDMFVSLLYLILERNSGEITMSRAGHELPLLYRRSTNQIEVIETPGMAAGVDQGPVFKRSVKDFRFQMESGDILLLYTDGVIESQNMNGDEFGLDKLSETVISGSKGTAEELAEAIIEEVKEFSKGMAQSDDITLIAIQKR